MSIQSEIDRINQAKTDLAAAIESKGVTVPPNTTINVYPGLVQQIEQGAGLPTGGTPGQMLYQGEDGPEWGDKPVMYVTITGDEESGYTADKTAAEVYQAYQDGHAVFAKLGNESGTNSYPIVSAYVSGSVHVVVFGNVIQTTAGLITMSDGSGIDIIAVVFQNFSDLYAKQEYVDGIKPKSVSVTLSASNWSSNTQTVTVNGVLADEAKQLIQPMPAIASQSAYYAAGIMCTGQAANSLTFTCQTVPTENLTVYVVIQEVSA